MSSKKNLEHIKELQREGNIKEAKKALLHYLNEKPNDTEALHTLSIICVQEESFPQAINYLKKAISLQPNNPLYHLHLANILKIEGFFDQSIESLNTVIKLDPKCLSAYNNLGNIFYLQGNLSESILAYKKSLALQPDYIDATYNLGLSYIKNNENNVAIELYENLLKNVPAHFAARFQLACLFMKENNLKEAEKNFLIIEESHPYHFETQTNLATCYLKLGALKEAKAHYKNAHELSREDTQILFNLGVIDTQLGNIDNAIQHYQKTTHIDEGHFEAHNNLGNLFILKNHPDFALKHFRAALQIQPDNKAIRYTVDALSRNQHLFDTPPEYITTLFDAYADHYDAHLLTVLEYKIPLIFKKVFEEIIKVSHSKWNILDLGCGTGLCGEIFHPFSKKLVGVDISEKMLSFAAQKNIYSELIRKNILELNYDNNHKYELIMAGDVVVYMGDLENLFSNITHLLEKKGFFLFNTEISEKEDYVMNQSGRFSHNKKYIEKLASKHSFEVFHHEKAITRIQNFESVLGDIYILQYK